MINNNIWKSYERRMAHDDFDFDPAELQSLLRVASLICKDRYEPTIREGLTCLRTLFGDSRMQWIDPAEWASLLQFQLFPAVKDALHSLMSTQHVVTLPRGRKFSHSPIIQQIIEVGFHVSTVV